MDEFRILDIKSSDPLKASLFEIFDINSDISDYI